MPALKLCTHCGYTWEEVQKKKSLGCAECYSVFAEEVRLLQDSIPGQEHNNTAPVPASDKGTGSVQEAVLQKKEELRALIRQEKFEDAARVRDELARLKNAGSY